MPPQKIKTFSEKFAFFLELSQYFFNFLLILMHIFEKLPQILGLWLIVKFRFTLEKSDPPNILWTPSTEKSCINYCCFPLCFYFFMFMFSLSLGGNEWHYWHSRQCEVCESRRKRGIGCCDRIHIVGGAVRAERLNCTNQRTRLQTIGTRFRGATRKPYQ